jgi:hypothetical protein
MKKLNLTWKDLKLEEFNKTPLFKDAMDYLQKTKIAEKFPRYSDRPYNISDKLCKMLEKHIDKKLKDSDPKVYKFYCKYLAYNMMTYNRLIYLKQSGELDEKIWKMTEDEIGNPFLATTIGSTNFAVNVPLKNILQIWRYNWDSPGFLYLSTYYLAAKWFFTKDTKKYYTNGCMESLEDFSKDIESRLGPNEIKKIYDTGFDKFRIKKSS